MNTLLILVLLCGIIAVAVKKKVDEERRALDALVAHLKAQIEEMNKNPLVIALKLDEEIALLKAASEKLADLPETRSERVILKEQLRIASFEVKLYEMVHKGCHPNPDAINTDWCLTSARLQLQFAQARMQSIKSIESITNKAAGLANTSADNGAGANESKPPRESK